MPCALSVDVGAAPNPDGRPLCAYDGRMTIKRILDLLSGLDDPALLMKHDERRAMWVEARELIAELPDDVDEERLLAKALSGETLGNPDSMRGEPRAEMTATEAANARDARRYAGMVEPDQSTLG